MSEAPIDLNWRGYYLKIALGFAWMLIAAVAGGSLEANPPVMRVLAALVLTVPPLIWLVLKWLALNRLDEFQSSIETRGLVRGMLIAMTYAPAIFAMNLVLPMIGITHVKLDQALDAVVRAMLVQPAWAFLLSEMAAQALRKRYAKR